MTRVITPGARSGAITAPASKSQAHRLLICAALGKGECEIRCDGVSADIAATARCMAALGAQLSRIDDGRISVRPIMSPPTGECILPCGESGSTLRFLLPVVGALGARAVFEMEGRLPERPLAPLDGVLAGHGMTLTRAGNTLHCAGRLSPGEYKISGDVSSQYISGLLMALPLLNGESCLEITGRLESAGYVAMTEDALALSGAQIEKCGAEYIIRGSQRFSLPPTLTVEADWSNAAFFLCMGALSARGVAVRGLRARSSQGDRAALELLARFGAGIDADASQILVYRRRLCGIEIDAAPIPDLIPVMGVLAALAEGETRIYNAARLRLKESDRLESTAALIRAVGGEVAVLRDGLVIRGRQKLPGGRADVYGDHRIAMAAAVAACGCTGAVEINDDACVAKSYPRFWTDFSSLEGESI